MAQQMKAILIILMVVLAVYAGVSAMLLERTRKQAIQEMDEMSKLYTDELDNRFLRIGRSLFSNIMEKNQGYSVLGDYIETMEHSGDPVKINNAVSNLRRICLSYAWEYGTEYHFFLYLKKNDMFTMLTMTGVGYDIDKDLEDAVRNQLGLIADTSYSVKKKWNQMDCGEENYICKIAQNQDVYMGCFVNVKSILEPFTDTIVGDDGYVRLVDARNRVAGQIASKGIEQELDFREANSGYSLSKNLKQAPFTIQMKISGDKILGVMMGSLGFLLVLAAALVLAGAAILLYLKKYLPEPVREFTDNLTKYDDDDYTFHITENNLMELEQIDGKFKRMIHQIRRLKIALYEQELEKQKIEMDYLKLQIRPHFYLNCLNFIYSMIDFKQYGNAQKMTKTTSDYLQYVFRSTSGLVPVKAETAHCEDYLKVLLLRYPDSFEYYIEIDKEVENGEIFPFMLQVFVENAAKHALTLEEKILISVTAFPEDREDGKYINLYISDTGKGFPKHVLERLRQGRESARTADMWGLKTA
ncbi:histidine kinase [Blautia sp. RD014234]|nr:histidine kinase [Blautia parvula]